VAVVQWTDPALEQLREITDFLAQHSAKKATEVGEKVMASTRQLVHSPLMGRVVPEFQLDYLRELVVQGYHVLYVVRGETCSVVAVIHSGRNLENLVRPDELET
jgi:plasmid stabilization system protein ParE